jgi:NAD(P)H-flavin reductase
MISLIMQATITKIDQLSDEVKLFRLEFPQGTEFRFLSGQFVMVSLKNSEGDVIKRAYSIASSPSKKYIELTIKIFSDGKMTQLLNTCVVGDTVEIQGPYGKASVNISNKKEIILISTGCGVGAARSIIHDLLESHYPAPIWLFFGFRYDKDFLFKHELMHLEEKYAEFHFIPVMSRPGPHSDPDIDVGHVTDVIPEYILDANNKEAFICGSSPMAKEVIATLQRIGFTLEHIKTDVWG